MGWNSQGLVAVKVIVQGGEPGDGVFVYSGAPGAGDLVASMAWEVETDPYGNLVLDGVLSYGPDGGHAQLAVNQSSGVPYLILWPSGTAHVQTPPQVYSVVLNPGAAEYYQLQLTSGQPSGDEQSSGIFLISAAEDSSSAAFGALQIAGASVLQWDQALIQVYKPVIASQPGTAAPEAWHPITLAPNWGTIAGRPVPSYRMLPDGNVQLTGAAGYSSAFSSGQQLTAAADPLPAAYCPATAQGVPGIGTNAWAQVDTNGVIVAEPPSGSTSVAFFNGTYPVNL